MASEGDLDKVDGDVFYAEDIKSLLKTTKSNLECINGLTQLNYLNTFEDKSYSDVSSDIFTDTTGYNNTVDTATTTATDITTDYYDGNTGDVWAEDEVITPTVTSFNRKSRILSSSPEASPSLSDDVEDMGISTTTQEQVVKKYDFSACYVEKTVVAVNSTVGNSKYSIWGYDVLLSKWVRLVNKTATSNSYVTYTATFSPRYINSIAVVEGGGTAAIHTPYVKNLKIYKSVFETPKIVQTNSKTFTSNIKSVFITADIYQPTNTLITVDISSDGGSTWDKTEQGFNSIIVLDKDNTDLVLKFNLKTTDTNITPIIKGYAVQVYT